MLWSMRILGNNEILLILRKYRVSFLLTILEVSTPNGSRKNSIVQKKKRALLKTNLEG